MGVRLIQIGLEVLDRGRYDVNPIVRDVTSRGAFEAADQRIVEQIFVGMQPHQNRGIPDESGHHFAECDKAEARSFCFNARKAGIHADAGQRRERRHHEQKMPQSGVRRAMADDLASQRETNDKKQRPDFLQTRVRTNSRSASPPRERPIAKPPRRPARRRAAA